MADLYTPYRNYVKKMLTFQGREKGTAKVLILDNDTVGSIRVESLSRVDAVFSCSIFSKRDSRLRWLDLCSCTHSLVFLTEKLGAAHEDMKHLIVGLVSATLSV